MQTLKIVKIGGNIINDEVALHQFLDEFALLKTPKLLVHGGGKLATQLSKTMGVATKMIDGRRVTDAATLDIATMVYAGKINKTIVGYLQSKQCNAIGFTGADGNTIVSKKRAVNPVDFGFVGDVIKVNPKILNLLLQQSITPVFCAITHDKNGQLLNTNADTIAAQLAIALVNTFKVELYYCFEKNGVLLNVEDENSLIETLNVAHYEHLKHKQVIYEGMLPKLDNCFNAIKSRVNKVGVGQPKMVFKTNSKYTKIEL